MTAGWWQIARLDVSFYFLPKAQMVADYLKDD